MATELINDLPRFKALLASLLVVLTKPRPAGEAYAVLMAHLTLEEFELVVNTAARSGLLTKAPSFMLTLTHAGLVLARKAAAVMATVEAGKLPDVAAPAPKVPA